MKRILWFTCTNIACKESEKLEFDLTPFLDVFLQNELWKKKRYRTEYNLEYTKEDLQKIKSVRIYLHTERAPLSNFHSYEQVLSEYIDLSQIEKTKLFGSGISEAAKIAVVDVHYSSDHHLMQNLTYEQEKNPELVLEHLTRENLDTWAELQKLKSVICEFMQFFMFNLHLNFLTHSYTFNITDKPKPVGFTVITENGNCYYHTDRMELLAHYILYEPRQDHLCELMNQTAKFWCTTIPTIYFFLDALKSNYVTSTHFLKLVFTLESFFGSNISNDYMTLVLPLLISGKVSEMKSNRDLMRHCFKLRNEIVHGNALMNFLEEAQHKVEKDKKGMDELYFNLKNLIIKVFYFYINKGLYLNANTQKINHELIFTFLPQGIL